MARPAKFDEVEVLDRATELFWRAGCDAVSIRDLEVALELRAPSIYRRYPTKDALVARSVERYVDRVVRGRIRRYFDDGDDPLAGLRAFFVSVLVPVDGEAGPRGCLLTVTAGQAAFAVPEVRAEVLAGFRLIERAFAVQVTRAQAAGQVRPELDPRATAAALLASFEGLLVLARAGRPRLRASVEATLAPLLVPS